MSSLSNHIDSQGNENNMQNHRHYAIQIPNNHLLAPPMPRMDLNGNGPNN